MWDALQPGEVVNSLRRVATDNQTRSRARYGTTDQPTSLPVEQYSTVLTVSTGACALHTDTIEQMITDRRGIDQAQLTTAIALP